MFNVLYYTGFRIGEATALTYNYFVPDSQNAQGEHLRGTGIKVTKSYVSDRNLTKDPENFKKRTVPPYIDSKLYSKGIVICPRVMK